MRGFIAFFIGCTLFFSGFNNGFGGLLVAQNHSIIGKYNYYGYNSEILALAGIRSVVAADSALVFDNPLAASRLLQNSISLFANSLLAAEYFLWGGVVSVPTDLGVFSLGLLTANENHVKILPHLEGEQWVNFKKLAVEQVDLVQSKISFAKEIFKDYDFGSSLNVDYGWVSGGDEQHHLLGVSLDLALQFSQTTAKNKLAKSDEEIFGFYNLQYGVLVQNLGLLPAIKNNFYKPALLKGGTAFDLIHLPLTWEIKSEALPKIKALFCSKVFLEATVAFPGDVYASLASKNTFQFANLSWSKIKLTELSLQLGYSLELLNPLVNFLPLFLGFTSRLKVLNNKITGGYTLSASVNQNQFNHNFFLNFIFGEFDSSNPEIKAIFQDSENDIEEGIILE